MGFLHDGHRELLRIGKREARGGRLVLSIFVNPAQFGPREDYRAYPRDMGRDLSIAGEEGVDAVFAPKAEEMYPAGYETYVEVEGLSKYLCGRSRPGHFRGVATVVLKLFNVVMPHAAVFGKKDYQQLTIIKRMAKDLDLDIGIVGVETVREPDGLAMSSRNSYLGAAERQAASVIPRALFEAEALFSAGVRDGAEIRDKMKKIIEKEPLAVVEYIEVCDPDTLEDLSRITGSALVALAVRVGKARLIDNRVLKGQGPQE
jgi:pantoate--beta-alanine ligase